MVAPFHEVPDVGGLRFVADRWHGRGRNRVAHRPARVEARGVLRSYSVPDLSYRLSWTVSKLSPCRTCLSNAFVKTIIS
jgi:hypothetical protein